MVTANLPEGAELPAEGTDRHPGASEDPRGLLRVQLDVLRGSTCWIQLMETSHTRAHTPIPWLLGLQLLFCLPPSSFMLSCVSLLDQDCAQPSSLSCDRQWGLQGGQERKEGGRAALCDPGDHGRTAQRWACVVLWSSGLPLVFLIRM